MIVALSDTHLGSQLGARWLTGRVAQVNALAPDMIVLLGDIFEGHNAPAAAVVETLKQLSAPLGIWAVPGNHEFHGGGGLQLFEDSGFRLLRNQWAGPGPGLVVAGVDDFTSAHRIGAGSDFITRALEKKPPGAVILLSHTPWHTGTAAKAGVGLMLAGHTHGGQIWPMGYLIRTRYPLLGGRYEVADMTVIVCRGTGTWGPRMRLWRPGEILHVTLRSKETTSPSES